MKCQGDVYAGQRVEPGPWGLGNGREAWSVKTSHPRSAHVRMTFFCGVCVVRACACACARARVHVVSVCVYWWLPGNFKLMATVPGPLSLSLRTTA